MVRDKCIYLIDSLLYGLVRVLGPLQFCFKCARALFGCVLKLHLFSAMMSHVHEWMVSFEASKDTETFSI